MILSGTASDGTVGLEAIKAEGGITFAQDESAAYDSMPRNAVAVGCVDFVLSPEDIAKELARIAMHPYGGEFLSLEEHAEPRLTPHQGEETSGRSGERGLPSGRAKMARSVAAKGGADRTGQREDENGFQEILLFLHKKTGVDFSQYKHSTIRRRVLRRMVLTSHETLDDYIPFLRTNPKELDALYTDALISVTSFFRNRDVFDALESRIIPDLLRRPGDHPCRVWVVGCSTGQEVYSIAMACMEAMDQAPARARSIYLPPTPTSTCWRPLAAACTPNHSCRMCPRSGCGAFSPRERRLSDREDAPRYGRLRPAESLRRSAFLADRPHQLPQCLNIY